MPCERPPVGKTHRIKAALIRWSERRCPGALQGFSSGETREVVGLWVNY